MQEEYARWKLVYRNYWADGMGSLPRHVRWMPLGWTAKFKQASVHLNATATTPGHGRSHFMAFVGNLGTNGDRAINVEEIETTLGMKVRTVYQRGSLSLSHTHTHTLSLPCSDLLLSIFWLTLTFHLFEWFVRTVVGCIVVHARHALNTRSIMLQVQHLT